MELCEAADRFRRFGEIEAKESSPLYAALAIRIADEAEILAVAAKAPPSQPLPNLLFASVQFLLAKEGKQIATGDMVDASMSLLRMTVLDRAPEVEHLLRTRLVQTNEVRRSIFLFSAFSRICRIFPGRDVALIEIGASAGLNLLFDQYEFSYGDASPFGALGSPVSIHAELRDGKTPPTETPSNSIVTRVGLELNPIDPHNEDDTNWLRALVWPEHKDRRELLAKALEMRRTGPVTIVQGDGVALLPSLLESVPSHTLPFVFHTYVANQLSAESKNALTAEVDRQGQSRDVVHLHNNIDPLHLCANIYKDGSRVDIALAKTEGHARWVEWIDG